MRLCWHRYLPDVSPEATRAFLLCGVTLHRCSKCGKLR